jgi:hypothetical protein
MPQHEGEMMLKIDTCGGSRRVGVTATMKGAVKPWTPFSSPAEFIANGKGMMPSFKNSLSSEQIHDLVGHVRAMRQQHQAPGPGAVPQSTGGFGLPHSLASIYQYLDQGEKGGAMMRVYRMLLTLVVGSICLFGVLVYAGDAPKSDGAVSVQVESWVPRGEGFGFTWGKGMLRMTNGITQVFTLEGLGVRGNVGGTVDMEAHGQVFNLKNAADFAGTYKKSPGDTPAGTDPKALVMKNEKGVVVVLEVKVETTTYPDLTLDASDQDVKVKLES